MSMMDGDSNQYSKIDRLVAITGFSKIEIKTLAYLGNSTQQIIVVKNKKQNPKNENGRTYTRTII